ncbi:sulfite exporter TauE/SafE family protein [Peribacillus kribbensis]|uniref:sulfite exporter TauE/SafE family protein n=1 Tax=Peribacillus kribbensis TaxID=356658 RepID=UPI000400EA3C|nr:sulfite exporter TauE/SafE family protein [Peribacillus kribbensis]
MEYMILYILLGAVIGVMSGMFGIGGGLFLTPILLLTGVPPVEAITTSLFYTMGTSISGMAGHLRAKNTNVRNSIIIGIIGVAGTQVAQPLVLLSEKRGYDDTIIPLLYIVLLLYFAYSMLNKGKKSQAGADPSGRNRSIWSLVLIGFTGGFVSSALGVGGGFIIVPLLISIYGESAKRAVGTSIVGVLMIVTAGFIGYAFNVHFDLKLAIVLLAGGLIGAQGGVKVTNYFTSNEIKFMLGLLYLFTTVSVALKLFNQSIAGLGIITLFTLYVFIRILIRMFSKTKIRENE